MSQSVRTFEPRINFVQGWLTGGTDPEDGSVECGDGTAFPLEVTLDQLAEIMYRVRDSEFVAGEVDVLFTDDSDPPIENHNICTFTFGAPPTELYQRDFFDFLMRGYSTSVLTPDPLIDPDPMANYGLSYFGESYTVNDSFSDIKVRETVGERALWAATEDPVDTFLIGKYQYYNGDAGLIYFLTEPSDTRFRTGFSYFGQDGQASGIVAHPYGLSDFTFAGGSTAYVNFSGRVAWLDVDNSGNPFSPNNRIFVGMIFAQGNDPVVISTNNTEEIAPAFAAPTRTADTALNINFELELADGVVVSCPLYWGTYFTPSGGPATVHAATNYRLKATQWWPYPYQDGGGGVWNPATGLPA